ncbi:CDP-diacylglycerol-serine O-phosphatidyltransferase [Candidatus Photodesmus katoptron]|uniref:CDP-diacylglycerol--serine O-phosphatidyltransferase n=1 Tax=Candidatus Photodesmus katoptron Akat1 TaxID=1236703 RepID=S3DL22_9GAMM|nr:CDP-diacylglycerol--serine O-phosphatidyltransferase [Candidatus Photodesmus katoptron]EPE37824.1 CDP-diacylglycerol--serine O-phosphatidyltransferase [Candidatus Photodesmus katoptron Akat1]KEY90457.1 CDP-diacylglycerol-serine O-phosphatidyltransferase [Candidatus Photodesmus katoptron]
MIAKRNSFNQLPTLAMNPEKFKILYSAKKFRNHIINAIKTACTRIYLVALYLEDDEAGREILSELYKAKKKKPELDTSICVDWHRAQRGLIGEASSEGNAAMYKSFSDNNEYKIPIFGVPIHRKEIFGVLHLKGFIVDNQVIYSGASLNNLYLNYHDRYRFDRYHILNCKALADSMVQFIRQEIIDHPAVNDLTSDYKPSTKDIKTDIRQLRASLAQSSYQFISEKANPEQIAITPIVGIGKHQNRLNQIINQLITQAKKEIFICTPYFNLPKSIIKKIKIALNLGLKVTIIVGDKTANDFYISPKEKFKAIGGLPYLYEVNLRQFAKANQADISSCKLSINLWKHNDNSFHLKGIWVDKHYMLITGNNLNPRGWKLDLENAILIQDNFFYLTPQVEKEIENILRHTKPIFTYRQLEKVDNYPKNVKKLIRKIIRIKADHVLKHIL